MQFSGRRQKIVRLTGDRQADLYPHSLQFYGQPPTENISLSEFETFAVDRLKLLKTVENLGVSYVKTSDQYATKLEGEFRKLNFSFRVETDEKSLDTEYDKRRKDHISHFILRLAYCQTEDLRRWFIQQEMDLFRYRFHILTKEPAHDFLKFNNLHYESISDEEKNTLKEELINSSYGFSAPKVEDHDFYKVPFQDALDLVRGRKVYLREGLAYIPHQEIVAIVLNDFRTRLSKALAVTLAARNLLWCIEIRRGALGFDAGIITSLEVSAAE
ncbi:DNA primase large subunit isoform X2 [Acipenser ruthenus]|uniref:DNA primase large subunit isoform X2 n=1 Tax=Acipenser ruthenus TaxID=7906 RepID=UPI00274290EA|nr:DNA primase large subunit isoform X2 [Acipenser ruthenus]